MPGWPGHRAGQHVDVRLTAADGYQAQRSYSIASSPGDALLELTVERIDDGEVSPYLVDELRVGDRSSCAARSAAASSGRVPGGPLLLLAGGSGIVPLRAMLRHRAARGTTCRAHALLVALAGRADLPRRARRARRRPPRLFTREWPDGFAGRRGRIDAAYVDAIAWPTEQQPIAFVCGPNGFVEQRPRRWSPPGIPSQACAPNASAPPADPPGFARALTGPA